MEGTFLGEHTAAFGLVVATIVAAALVEWAVTYRERVRTTLTAGSAGRARVALATLVETTTTRTAGEAPADRGTKRVLVGSMIAALLLGFMAARRLPGLASPGNGWAWVAAGLAAMWSGILVRAWAIAVLGRFFRRDVVLQTGHEVVESGPYRRVRHPAYSGNLLVAAGLGLALVNWASLAILVVVPIVGHLPRIRVEESELEEALGAPYRDYELRTARLVPGVW